MLRKKKEKYVDVTDPKEAHAMRNEYLDRSVEWLRKDRIYREMMRN